MDVRIEAAPMTAQVEMTDAVVETVKTKIVHKAITWLKPVASISCPSIGGTSLSAISPDSDFERKQAVAA